MNDNITSYLVLKGSCLLPGIGRLEEERGFAANDVASKEIHPPEMHYKLYEDNGAPQEGFIKYIAVRENTDRSSAKQLLINWCEKAGAYLSQNETVNLPFIGTLKNEEGKIILLPEESGLPLPSVKAIRVVHENDTHKVLVGDRESDTVSMNEFLQQGENNKSHQWYKYAIIIFMLTVLIYLSHIFSNGFSLRLHPVNPPPTYISK